MELRYLFFFALEVMKLSGACVGSSPTQYEFPSRKSQQADTAATFIGVVSVAQHTNIVTEVHS